MTENQRHHYSQVIDQHLAELETDIKNLKDLTQPVSPDNAIGRISRMEALNDLTVHKANLAKAQKRQGLLEKAKQRVTTEDFGLCLRCKEEIDPKRLEILPESQICMVCIKKPAED